MEEQTQKKDSQASGSPPEADKPKAAPTESDSLETASAVDETATKAEVTPKSGENVTDTTHGAEIKKKNPVIHGVSKITRVNLYLLLFFLALLLAGIITFISYQRSKVEEQKKDALLTEPLSQETLDKLKQSDVRVGDPKQILSIESNAIFSGKVLIRDSLEVAGQLKIGGPLNLSGITVSGASAFDQITANNLDVSGNTNIQGQLSVQQGVTIGGNLSVSGSLSASQLTLQGLELNGDLKLNRHIDSGGGTPGKSNGGALGGGGTASVSGTDTAGTINIRTGGGSGTGCYITVRFTQSFNSKPHVVISPVDNHPEATNGQSLRYYVTRGTTEFSICTNNAAGGGKNFAFSYIVID